jgi:predicted ATPase
VHCFCGDVPAARDVAEAAVAFGQEVRNPFWLAMARVIWGWVSAWLWPCYLALLAEALTRANQTEQALEAIDNALAAVSATRENFYLAELHRLRGVLLRRLRPQQNEARAESECLQALEIAKSQGARSLELRAATSLGHLWRDQGKRTEAHDLLAPIYGWFTEGFDTPVLKDAKALLDELA